MNSIAYLLETRKKIKLGVVLGQNLGKIISNVVKKVKKQVISLCFFHILLVDYLLKQEAVVVKPPKWKFMAIIARSTNFKDVRANFLPDLVKNGQKNLIIFYSFTLVSQS